MVFFCRRSFKNMMLHRNLRSRLLLLRRQLHQRHHCLFDMVRCDKLANNYDKTQAKKYEICIAGSRSNT